MNNVKIRDLNPKTLLLISGLIDRRINTLRKVAPFARTQEQKEEIANLLEFQTQILYAHQLATSEQTTLSN